MISGRDFAVLAEKLKERKPHTDDAISAWVQFQKDVDAIADACFLLNPQRFRRSRFLKQIYSSQKITSEKARELFYG